MKKTVYFLWLLILVLGLGTVKKAIAVEEVIVNGGFETGNIEPWVNPTWYPDKWNVVSAKSHSGSFSAYTYTGSSGGTAVLSQSFSPTLVDNITSFHYWYYAETMSSPNLALGLWFSDGSYDQDFIWGILTNQWAFRDVMPVLLGHSGKYLVKIGIYDTLQTGLYIDDVCLEATPECKCDLTHDGTCDMEDWLLFGEDWGRTDCYDPDVDCECDLNNDGRCDMSDWLIFGEDWGRTDCPVYPRIEKYSNSGCLPGSAFDSPGDQYPWCGSDEIEAFVEDHGIHVTHRNATYNCCPDDIKVSMSVEGNLLRLLEKEILTHPCFCLCCYDVKASIVGLLPGAYTLEYCWDDYETGPKCHMDDYAEKSPF
jgi:hypothetical protein